MLNIILLCSHFHVALQGSPFFTATEITAIENGFMCRLQCQVLVNVNKSHNNDSI